MYDDLILIHTLLYITNYNHLYLYYSYAIGLLLIDVNHSELERLDKSCVTVGCKTMNYRFSVRYCSH